MKVRVSLHKGKSVSKKHNDRNFDIAKTDYISDTLMHKNIYGTYFENQYKESDKASKMTFEESRELFYKMRYSKALEAQNERHRKARQYSRIKDMAQFMTSDRYAPTEEIIQIGNRDKQVDPHKATCAMAAYVQFLDKWNQTNANHLHIIDYALHIDEPNGTPHLHITTVYDYTDKNGVLQIGKEKALEMAGISLPEANKPNSRTNNRNVTFTAMCREKWQEIAVQHGFDVETTPEHIQKGTKRRRHQDKENFIATQKAMEREANAIEREFEAEALIKQNQRQYEHLQRRKAEFKQREVEIEEEKQQYLEAFASYAEVEIESRCRKYVEEVKATADVQLAQEISKATADAAMPIICMTALEMKAQRAVAEKIALEQRKTAPIEILNIPSMPTPQDRDYNNCGE